MSLWTRIEGGFNKVAHLVEDIVTIDVVTLTGAITLSIDDAGPPPKEGEAGEAKKLSLGRLYERLRDSALDEDTDIEVVAFTHIEVDADSVNFVKKGLTTDQTALLTAHNEAVRAAQETREGIIRTMKSFF